MMFLYFVNVKFQIRVLQIVTSSALNSNKEGLCPKSMWSFYIIMFRLMSEALLIFNLVEKCCISFH